MYIEAAPLVVYRRASMRVPHLLGALHLTECNILEVERRGEHRHCCQESHRGVKAIVKWSHLLAIPRKRREFSESCAARSHLISGVFLRLPDYLSGLASCWEVCTDLRITVGLPSASLFCWEQKVCAGLVWGSAFPEPGR